MMNNSEENNKSAFVSLKSLTSWKLESKEVYAVVAHNLVELERNLEKMPYSMCMGMTPRENVFPTHVAAMAKGKEEVPFHSQVSFQPIEKKFNCKETSTLQWTVRRPVPSKASDTVIGFTQDGQSDAVLEQTQERLETKVNLVPSEDDDCRVIGHYQKSKNYLQQRMSSDLDNENYVRYGLDRRGNLVNFRKNMGSKNKPY